MTDRHETIKNVHVIPITYLILLPNYNNFYIRPILQNYILNLSIVVPILRFYHISRLLSYSNPDNHSNSMRIIIKSVA